MMHMTAYQAKNLESLVEAALEPMMDAFETFARRLEKMEKRVAWATRPNRRGPGRPPKKRGPGRPPKYAYRGPGRPPKRRGPGRPPKYPRRGPGRPPKYPRRGPGRPPKRRGPGRPPKSASTP